VIRVYETLLDPGRVAIWTRSRPDIFRHIGSVFSLFDGNVTGTIVELVQNEKIVQTWRLKSWPEGHFSTVTIKFEQASDCTRVRITQEGVPIGEVDAVRNNWQSYYWNPIKSVFGYGSISSSSSSIPLKSKNKSSKPRKNRRGSDLVHFYNSIKGFLLNLSEKAKEGGIHWNIMVNNL